MSYCQDLEFNGRIHMMKPEDLTQHKLFSEPSARKSDFNKMAIKNIHSDNPLFTVRTEFAIQHCRTSKNTQFEGS